MVTIKDVAKKANVSIATVSAVINNNKFVSDQLKERVEQAIQEIGYRPNRVARSLKKKETHLIGVVVTEITNPFYPLMLKGVEDIALLNKYKPMLCTTDDDSKKEFELIQSMVDQGVDGVILATVDKEHSRSVQFLEQEKIPHVLINRAPFNYDGNLVRINSYRVGELATEFLLNQGHRDIAIIVGNRLNSWEREKGFKETLLKQGIVPKDNRIIQSEYNMKSAYRDIQTLIEKGDLPTAIFAVSDVMAFGTIKALLDHGLKVPQDISVIGSDNITFSEDFRIPLTTVDAKAYEIGKMGCKLLVDLLQMNKEDKGTQQLIEPELVIRESCRSLMTTN
ncbi:LacI family DNA-binding transcriptional regulator [Pullulanibacillus sp. KACC 23026]|uniref:LacI family DNA-binding transcriptional regulator n=1 Tax=Pullulanibacillus sp. KACC 23026 TaxID=3028315 RepID=UPI0023B14AC1|nr:LacI family DNA-binding transcriptional regulator [Pullulanibacillus sp. KACC 23026]WEG13417.1 LacI family DNA-binding transcriptional regulator [Pullulanibacillus sp. KACC 23026]